MRESSEPSTQPYSIFKAFEHKAWQTAVDQYDAAFSRLTQQAIPSIVEALDLRPGVRLLDAACGPGNLAAAALRLRASVLQGRQGLLPMPANLAWATKP
jgi:cyclopropane fatty-acyl-phospholipid synthase-like methyltransferase